MFELTPISPEISEKALETTLQVLFSCVVLFESCRPVSQNKQKLTNSRKFSFYAIIPVKRA
jgi:hypothetical protein